VVSVADRQGEVEGGEQATTRRADVSTLSARQSGDVVPTLSSPGRLSTVRGRHGRLRQMRTENPRHRSNVPALVNVVDG